MIVGEPHAYWLPPQVVEQDQRTDAAAEQRGADVVDLVAAMGRVQVQPRDDDPDRDHRRSAR